MESKNHTNIVHNQDARSILKFISPEIKVRTTITSPPYYDMKDYDSDNQIGYGQTYENYLEDLKVSSINSIYPLVSDSRTL